MAIEVWPSPGDSHWFTELTEIGRADCRRKYLPQLRKSSKFPGSVNFFTMTFSVSQILVDLPW